MDGSKVRVNSELTPSELRCDISYPSQGRDAAQSRSPHPWGMGCPLWGDADSWFCEGCCYLRECLDDWDVFYGVEMEGVV